MNYYLLMQIVIYSRSRSKKNLQKTKQMSCFLISCHARSERTWERESAWSVGCLSLGEGGSTLRERAREWRTLVPGDRRKVPRKYENRSARSFSLCKHPALGSRRSFLYCSTSEPFLSSLSRDCVIRESLKWRAKKLACNAKCTTLCTAFLLRILLLLFRASPLDLRGGLFAICWLLGICWQFRRKDGWKKKRWCHETGHC